MEEGPHPPQLLPHPEETRGSHFTISPNTGAQCQETQSKRGFRGLRPLKTLHCLRKASPHRGRSICNTVRGVAHYCPAPVPLCLFCAADRRIQLPGRANKRECSYIKKKKKTPKKETEKEDSFAGVRDGPTYKYVACANNQPDGFTCKRYVRDLLIPAPRWYRSKTCYSPDEWDCRPIDTPH